MQKVQLTRLQLTCMAFVALGPICFEGGQVSAKARPSDACTSAASTGTTACLVGEYSLTKDEQTGASLLLNPDNRFEWFYSDRVERKYATGRWQVRTGSVILTPDRPDPTAALFGLVSQEPWDETAETQLRLQQHDAAQALVEASCPVFVGPAVYVSAPPQSAAPSDLATKNANDALAQSSAAKRTYELAVLEAISAADSRKATLVETAESARNVWIQSTFKTDRTHQIAGLPVPALGEPNLPAVCTTPKMIYPRDVPETEWLRGISINVVSTSNRFLVSGVTAKLTYANGRATTLKIDGPGAVFTAFDPSQRVIDIELSVNKPSNRARRFTVTPIAQGVFNFTADGDLLNGPPFGSLSLGKVGSDLVSNGYLPGRYVRVSNEN